jgi:hypothetical protein
MVIFKKATYIGENMKQLAKKTLVATTIAIMMSSGATVVHGTDDDDSSSSSIPSSSSSSIPSSSSSSVPSSLSSVPRNPDGSRMTPVQRAAYETARRTYRTALIKYQKSKDAIEKKYRNAIRTADSARRAARKEATTDEAENAAKAAFVTAMSAARSARSTALTALGKPPVKPFKFDDDKKSDDKD